MMNKIDDKTLIPVSLLVAMLGAAGWLTMVYAKSETRNDIQDVKIEKLEESTQKQDAKLDLIIVKLIRLEKK